jgi:hypothetical protein
MTTKSSDDRAGELVIQKQLSYEEIEKVSKAFVASGMFGRDMDKISKGITKIMAGQELGLAPFASMRAVHVIEGNATLSANTMAGMVKSSGRYDYEVKKKEMDTCVIDFFEIRNGKRTKIGTESFDKEEARSAGLLNKQNWQKYPKAMMFARCISNGVRTYCPDVFSGMLVYTPDELDARVGDDGNIIDMDGDGNITKMPAEKKSKKKVQAQDADIDQTPPDYENEGTDDHPDVTDPNEPDIPEETLTEEDIEAANAASDEPEEEPEPPVTVDEEFKDTAWQMYESLPLKASYKMRWLKEVTGAITRKSIKLDAQWRDLMDRAGAVLSGDEEIDPENRTDVGEQEKIV